MDKRWQRGEVDISGIVTLAVIIFVIIIMPKDHSKQGTVKPGDVLTYSSKQSNTNYLPNVSNFQDISIDPGNASYAYQAYEEYVAIENHGDNPINITGWQIRNGKDKRAYDLGGSLQRFSADIATIPSAAKFVSPTGDNVMGPVILGRGERAIITTGKVGVSSPYQIVSFKENSCSGYLEALPEYAFNPPLYRSCPMPAKEPGLDSLDTNCRKFVERLGSCRTPQFETRDANKDICINCINGVPLSNSCVAYVREHFNYKGCIAYHSGDANFSGRTWRVFLNRSWEMYAENYETVELFDQFGKLVSFQNY